MLCAVCANFVNVISENPMKRTLTLLALVVCAMTALGAEKAKRVLVETPHLSLVLDLFADGQPR